MVVARVGRSRRRRRATNSATSTVGEGVRLRRVAHDIYTSRIYTLVSRPRLTSARGRGVNVAPMAKPLVIVESPAKARTIAGFLGGDFTVLASMGHIRDLPAKGLSVDVDNDFKVDYEVHASKKDVIRELKAALKDADELYLATDEDREGEAIRWHLLEVLKPTVPVKRMVFHEITQSAIEHAVDELPRHRLRPRRRPGEPPHRRPPLRLPGVRGVLAQDQPGPLRRPGAVARRAPRRRARARAHGVRAPPATGTSAPPSPPSPPSPPRSPRSTATRSPSGRDFDAAGQTKRDDVVVLDEAGAQRPRGRPRRPAVHRPQRRDQAVHVAARSRRSSPRRSSRWAAAGCA